MDENWKLPHTNKQCSWVNCLAQAGFTAFGEEMQFPLFPTSYLDGALRRHSSQDIFSSLSSNLFKGWTQGVEVRYFKIL